jgi:hypothetical protein
MKVRFPLCLKLGIALAGALLLPIAAYAGDVVTASITPGVTVADLNTIGSGQKIQTTIKLPDGYAPITFANGAAAGQVTIKWADTRSYAAAPVTYDLTALTAAASNTGAASFGKIKIIAIYNNEAANSGKDLIVGGGATLPFTGPLAGTTPTYTIKAGCAWVHFDLSLLGLDCSTNKNLKLDPGANTVSASVVFAGN